MSRLNRLCTASFLLQAALVSLIAIQAVAFGQDSAADEESGKKAFSCEDYAALLETFVSKQGLVDYSGLQKDREGLDAFVKRIGDLEKKVYDKWPKRDKLAFWLNVYNALTLKAIVDSYPLASSNPRLPDQPASSIQQFDEVWKKTVFAVMGHKLTLDQIEHAIIRRNFKEPRIHMAIVCGARSCPPLRREPYRGSELEIQLGNQSRRFLALQTALRIDREAGKVYVSQIFKWFGEDFVHQYGAKTKEGQRKPIERAVLRFISEHIGKDDAEYISEGEFEIAYLAYDWTLNAQGTATLGNK